MLREEVPMTNTTDRDHPSAPATNGAPCARSVCPTAETKTLAELAGVPVALAVLERLSKPGVPT
jgi:hypothetical protein